MSTTPTTRRVRFTGLAAAAVVAFSGLAITSSNEPSAAASAASDIPASWEKYVLGPDSPQVYPTAFADPRGSVTRPAALIERNGSMTLTTQAGQTPASVVLDFGK